MPSSRAKALTPLTVQKSQYAVLVTAAKNTRPPVTDFRSDVVRLSPLSYIRIYRYISSTWQWSEEDCTKWHKFPEFL